MYFDSKSVLYVVDASTSFQSVRFLKDMSVKIVWNTLQLCWIDIYLEPSDNIIYNAEKNFTSAEF
jgi:hypothetical protein